MERVRECVCRLDGLPGGISMLADVRHADTNRPRTIAWCVEDRAGERLELGVDGPLISDDQKVKLAAVAPDEPLARMRAATPSRSKSFRRRARNTCSLGTVMVLPR